jgi:uncharacterized protein YjiS (DUF1127 family)
LSRYNKIEFRRLSSNEIDALVHEARRLQTQTTKEALLAIARGFAWLARQIWSGLREVARSFSEAQAARRTYEQLSRLSDRELADMGLTREGIPAVVVGTFRREPDVVLSANREAAENAPLRDDVEQRYREAA